MDTTIAPGYLDMPQATIKKKGSKTVPVDSPLVFGVNQPMVKIQKASTQHPSKARVAPGPRRQTSSGSCATLQWPASAASYLPSTDQALEG